MLLSLLIDSKCFPKVSRNGILLCISRADPIDNVKFDVKERKHDSQGTVFLFTYSEHANKWMTIYLAL